LLNIRGFLKAGPRKNFSFKPVRSAKKVADPLNCLGSGPGGVGQGGLKVLHLWHHSQKLHNPQAKNYFECKLEDLPRLFSLSTALYHFRHPSYTHTK